jgi:hypothetical protein
MSFSRKKAQNAQNGKPAFAPPWCGIMQLQEDFNRKERKERTEKNFCCFFFVIFAFFVVNPVLVVPSCPECFRG